MKVLKLSAIAGAVLLSTSAMANVATDAGTVIVTGAKNTTIAVVDGTKNLFKTVSKPAAISAEVGTLGYGANIAWSLDATTELQAGWTGGDPAGLFKDKISVDGTEYKLDTKFSNPYLGVQMRPASNWLTIGAGVIVPDNDIKVKTENATGTQTVNGVDYRVNGVVEGTVEHRNKLAPYLSLGLRPNINNNWGLFGEIGATYLGKADVTIKSDNADFNKAAAKRIQDKEYSNWYPVAKIGATYRF
ncbi:hypothetical protein M2R47_01900 [Moraxella sp. Tifton1]|uniref:Outer membrane protein n=1 Tax=Moraxella oculi TaxID=2940516 RepID=A0ABW8U5S5_9GAMM|nr:hypothetical protein [Moraxella sp. Tifton1]MCL1623008.1 hypothetical protein [Moraxella sp. Tifton1]